jgi:hypothetical protein
MALVTVLTLFSPAFAFAADTQPKGLSDAQFERALRNTSTATPYVLVTVVDGNTGARQAACVRALEVLGAIQTERGIGWEEAMAFALAQSDRTFKFSNKDALKRMVREYSDQTLEEARVFLAKMTNEEVEAATHDQKSSLYEFIHREPQPFFRGRFQAVAHVLEERGLLTWAGCKPGIVSVEK